MEKYQPTPRERELLWGEVLSHLDQYASKSPSYGCFQDWLSCSGRSFSLEGTRELAGFLEVSGPGEQVSVHVHRVDGRAVEPAYTTVYRLKEAWEALTTPQLALY